MDNDKIIEYAIAWLEATIEKHENFINNFEGDKDSLAQNLMVERYKSELKQLEHMRDWWLIVRNGGMSNE